MNTGSTLIGALTTSFLGVIVVAAIYQLGTNSSNVTAAANNLGTLTLNGLFK
jgi:hypothetical protein